MIFFFKIRPDYISLCIEFPTIRPSITWSRKFLIIYSFTFSYFLADIGWNPDILSVPLVGKDICCLSIYPNVVNFVTQQGETCV